MTLSLLKKSALLPSLFLALLPGVTSAQEVFSDNFQDYSIVPPTEHIPLPTSKTPPALWWSADQNLGRSVEVVLDADDLFGRGTDNQFLRLSRPEEVPPEADLNAASMPFEPTQTGQVSFDFYVRSGGIQSTNNTGLIVQIMSDVLEGDFDGYDGRQVAIGLYITADAMIVRNNGSGKGGMRTDLSFSFSNDQKNTLTIVFNNSKSVYQYGSEKLEPGTMDIYLNGEKQDTWEMSQGLGAGIGRDINGLWLMMTRQTTGNVLLDNITVSGPKIK